VRRAAACGLLNSGRASGHELPPLPAIFTDQVAPVVTRDADNDDRALLT
jgi:hypothetical protein